MKIGDLAVWTKYASEWSRGPEAGSLAGVVVRILKHRRGPRTGRADRVELHAEGENFIVGKEYVEIINENR
jgi:hypothetical protein